jgi:membrane protease subunit HflC
MSNYNTAKNAVVPALFILVGLSLIALQGMFVVHETNQAIVFQFGDPVRTITKPGLNFKVPLIQNVTRFDARVLDVDPEPEEVILADQKRLRVDTFTRYRISDPLKFYQRLRTEQTAGQRLTSIINSSLRSILGSTTLADILSDQRSDIMKRIQSDVNTKVTNLGIDIIDVRIGRADLPEQTTQSIYERIRAERKQEANEIRAEGQEIAQTIRATAEKERTVILSEAEQKADTLRGQGDQKATKIYADSYGKDSEFYAFYRSLEAYREGLKNDNGLFLLSPESEFLNFLTRTPQSAQ